MQRFLYLVALFSIPLVEATEVKRASTAAPDTTLKTLRRRPVGTPLLWLVP